MEIFINPNYIPQLENEPVKEKIFKIKEDLNATLDEQIGIEDLIWKITFHLNNIWEKVLIYTLESGENITLGYYHTEKNKVMYIESINRLLKNFPQYKIKGLWSFILLKAIQNINSETIYLQSLDDTIWFYKKTLKRFKERWIIKDYEIDWLDIKIIKRTESWES